MNHNKKTKRLILSIIAIFISLNCLSIKVFSYSPAEAKEIEDFKEKNKSFLTSEDENTLSEIILKLNKYEVLSQEEREYIRECQLEVVRQKLGDSQFEEYKKLIEKRSSGAEFQQPERFRLYELEKLLK